MSSLPASSSCSRRRARRGLFTLALGAALLALGQGCGGDMLQPKFEIEGRRMVIIPFADAHSYHYFSEDGNRITRLLVNDLMARHKAEPEEVIETIAFEEVVKAVGEEDPTTIRHADMASRVKADVFCVGTLTRFETRRAGDVGVLRGRADMKLEVRETIDPKGKPLYEGRVAVTFPPSDYNNWGGLPTSDATEEDIKRGLQAALVQELSELFRWHEPEER